jgi:hypothetical protein
VLKADRKSESPFDGIDTFNVPPDRPDKTFDPHNLLSRPEREERDAAGDGRHHGQYEPRKQAR